MKLFFKLLVCSCLILLVLGCVRHNKDRIISESRETVIADKAKCVLGEDNPSVALKKLEEKIHSFQKNKSDSIKTQDLGRLNFKATKFGLGQNTVSRGGIDPVALIVKAYNLGVNYFDTSNADGPNQLYYGEAFKKLGLVPGLENYDEKKRHAVFFVSKTRLFSNTTNAYGCVDDIKRTLTQVFGDGEGNYPADAYIDMMMLHDIATIEEVNAVYEGLEEINKGIKPQRMGTLAVLKDFQDGTNLTGFNPKKEKVIKHIGVAAHYSPAPLMELIQRDTLNLLDGLLVTINPNDNLYFSMQNNLIPVAKAKNMGVIGMKVFAWGILAQSTPELTSHSLIEYALTTPGVDIIITGIAEISDNQQECQLYQNILTANNTPKNLSNKQREKIESLAKTVGGGRTNFFQARAVKLTKPRNIQLKRVNGDNIISWDNAYAGESKISHYNIIRNGKNIAKINYKPQPTLEQYNYIDKPTKEPLEYQISVTDQKGKTIISDTIQGLSYNPTGVGRIETVLVEAGSFSMGLNNREDDENPVHKVTLTKDFYIGKYEVTQAQYYKVMNIKPSYNAPTTDWEKLPVEQVSWYDAVEFCNRLSEMEGLDPYYHIDGTNVTIADKNGKGYRLPTEAEWEYAARGGKDGDPSLEYAGSNNIGLVAWYSDNSDNKTQEVGTKQANSLGIYDMSGNVCEWTWDWYGSYSSSPQTDPTGPTVGSDRLCRGGGYYIIRTAIWQIALRGRDSPSDSPNNLGFRVARFVVPI